jgi:hypothetical protein
MWRSRGRPAADDDCKLLRERFDGALDDGFLKLKEWKNAGRLVIGGGF